MDSTHQNSKANCACHMPRPQRAPAMEPSRDPLRELQRAAHRAAEYVLPGERAYRVVVFGLSSRKLLDIAVPIGAERVEDSPAPSGWVFDDRRAVFDGRVLAIGSARLRLLRTLAEAKGPLTAKEMTALAFDGHTAVENTRYHLRELRRELKAALAYDAERRQKTRVPGNCGPTRKSTEKHAGSLEREGEKGGKSAG